MAEVQVISSESASDEQNLCFYVTAGRGTEIFAKNEIQSSVLNPKGGNLIDVRDGKIFFKTTRLNVCLKPILNLKCVERVFVTIADYENSSSGKREFLNLLMKVMSTAKSYNSATIILNQLNSVLNKKQENSEGPPSKRIKTDLTIEINEPLSDLQPCTDEKECTLEASGGRDQCCKNENSEIRTFRMSIKCSGKRGKWINVKKLSKDLSWRVSQASNWRVDLKSPDHEICLHINDDYVTAGIPLTKQPLSRRPFIVDYGLRGPVAWIMTQLAEIKAGDLILDPMCGKGTLLLEACSQLKDVRYIGIDIDPSQLNVAQKNVKEIGFEKHIDLIHANGLYIPMKSSSVSSVVCDAPFNQKYFTSISEGLFYSSLLQEVFRVLQKAGKFVLLTSEEISMKLSSLRLNMEKEYDLEANTGSSADGLHTEDSDTKELNDKLAFVFVSEHYIKLGETHGKIVVMIKL